ncbi:hypothetical protein M409DRAFT_20051 [Zasmidium cellare ATCC 36951]|uniref:Uncharacterized protein n=1 Tax=Zasmidium cellare ATCC 36951 TaxID=1080233 RepID=A0A6A6CQR2_ZASCE|nr:uncharacterized protein M409DRAFT_20051 [Zasmidium cellare ATCC 36951]KAF2169637.1 hypothetical protein M409DRAFT_20051 [Zasmidium cellare ATCC 36951]
MSQNQSSPTPASSVSETDPRAVFPLLEDLAKESVSALAEDSHGPVIDGLKEEAKLFVPRVEKEGLVPFLVAALQEYNDKRIKYESRIEELNDIETAKGAEAAKRTKEVKRKEEVKRIDEVTRNNMVKQIDGVKQVAEAKVTEELERIDDDRRQNAEQLFWKVFTKFAEEHDLALIVHFSKFMPAGWKTNFSSLTDFKAQGKLNLKMVSNDGSIMFIGEFGPALADS